MTKTKGWIVQICLFLLATTAAFTQSADSTATPVVPRLVKFSGSLRDEAGHPKPGIAGVTFALYKEQTGGAPLWLETQNVTGDGKGNYTILLGSTKPEGLPSDLFTSNEAQWLGVQVEGQAEQPRILFVSVPYALKAADAETIGGLPPSAFVRAVETGTAGSNSSGQRSSAATSSPSSYPPAIRSTGAGWALGVGRIGTIAGPLIGGLLLGLGVPTHYIFVAASVPVFSGAVLMAILGRVRSVESACGREDVGQVIKA